MSSGARPKLRTKTGCLTCRQRRKKCDEKQPTCDNCGSSGRECQWPSPDDLVDRRFSAHTRSRYRVGAGSGSGATPSPAPSGQNRSADGSSGVQLPAARHEAALDREAALAHIIISRDIEAPIMHHFFDEYIKLTLVPGCHSSFVTGWVDDMRHNMTQCKSLYHSALTCSAAHFYLGRSSSSMQDLSLKYYAGSLKYLQTKISAPSPDLETNDAVLMSVILLYLFGLIGYGTEMDSVRHLDAAKRLMILRLRSKPEAIRRPLDRLALESILLQSFYFGVSLWSYAGPLFYPYDARFWIGAEKLLDRTTLFPDRPVHYNSPVIGFPISLLRLNLITSHCFGDPSPANIAKLKDIASEIHEWETVLLARGPVKPVKFVSREAQYGSYAQDATDLHAITASLTFNQLMQGKITAPGVPQHFKGDTWRITRAMDILRRNRHDASWSRTYLGHWPTYTLGFLVSDPADIDLVRLMMQRGRDLFKAGRVAQGLADLEMVWAARQSASSKKSSTLVLRSNISSSTQDEGGFHGDA